MNHFPDHAPLDEAQKAQLASALAPLTSEQIAWISGYLAGSSPGKPAAYGAVAAATQSPLTVLYGTESGNAENLAGELCKQAKQRGYKPTLVNMADTNPADLAKADKLLVVVSTWGDGEPPESAEEFYQSLMNEDHALAGVGFSVCALGDTSYEQFCQTGKEMDARLEALGAERVLNRVDCDVDYDEAFAGWSGALWEKWGAAATVGESIERVPADQPSYGKSNPFPAEVLENLLLSGERSDKETYHIELSLEGSGLEYEVGDVLGVVARNAADVVNELIQAAGLNGDIEVELKDVGKVSLFEALTVHLDITGLSRKVATAWQELSGSDDLKGLLSADDKKRFTDWSYGRQIIDLLEQFPASSLQAQQLADMLRKLPVRLYSIASSSSVHPGEVHLTVAAVRYEAHEKSRKGVASTYLADDAQKGSKVSVYTHQNKNFRLPESNETPIIMVGPGTGIAPFRAFIEERAATKAKGDSWLFFGDQHYNEDFLYQLEWQDYLKSGDLTRLDVAFSRDQPDKVYVQHKLAGHAQDVWQWLEKGAHFYVCGDASRMAKDVHQALLDIVASEGRMSSEDAEAYVATLKKQKRYQRDVY